MVDIPSNQVDNLARLRSVAAACSMTLKELMRQCLARAELWGPEASVLLIGKGQAYFDEYFPPLEGWGSKVFLDVRGSDLGGTVFAGNLPTGSCQLNGANFRGANLSNSQWFIGTLRNADFTNADLSGSNIQIMESIALQFTGANLTGATIVDLGHNPEQTISLVAANLSRATVHVFTNGTRLDLSGANMDGCQIRPTGEDPTEREQALNNFLSTLTASQRAQVQSTYSQTPEDAFRRDLKALFEKKLNSYQKELDVLEEEQRRTTPTSTQPIGASSKSGGCFIATAACASNQQDIIIELRRFRDVKLRRTTGGRVFITVYEAISPTFARWVARREWRRALARQVVVKPALRLARWFTTDGRAKSQASDSPTS